MISNYVSATLLANHSSKSPVALYLGGIHGRSATGMGNTRLLGCLANHDGSPSGGDSTT